MSHTRNESKKPLLEDDKLQDKEDDAIVDFKKNKYSLYSFVANLTPSPSSPYQKVPEKPKDSMVKLKKK